MQRHEAKILVELHMTVKEGESRVVRNKINFSILTAWHVDCILADSRSRFPSDSRYFKGMAVKMNRVIVAALVFHHHPVMPTSLDHQRIRIRPRLAVDRPTIKPSTTAGDFFEGEVETLIRFRSRRLRPKDGIIPGARQGLGPLGPGALVRILDHDTQRQ